MRTIFMLAAAVLIASPLCGALAQTSSPAGGVADTKPTNPAAMNSHTPGATGTTVVPGSKSTVASDKPATTNTKTGGTSTGSGGGGK